MQQHLVQIIFSIFLLTPFTTWATEGNAAFQQFISQYVTLNPITGKIQIPDEIKHVKLDIGLSYSAPMSQYWLSHETDLIVFGFEPNPESVQAVLSGPTKRDPSHGDPLELKYVGKGFHLIPCALGLSKEPWIKFYITSISCGCCSIFEPSILEVADIIEVPIFSLSDFFDLFPFETHPIIEYIKVDAQGADLDIIKSAGSYLSRSVLFVTLEAENTHYKNTINSGIEIESYMSSIGFSRFQSQDTQDPTYVNERFIDYIQSHNVKIYQQG